MKFGQFVIGIFILFVPFLLISGVVFLTNPKYTAPTHIVFIDEKNNTPIKGLKVRFTWAAFDGFIAVGSSWAYHTEVLTTAADGSVTLPRIKKPFPVNFLIYQRDHLDIWIHFRSWKFEEEAHYGGGVYGPFKIHGNESEATIKLIPAANLDVEIGALHHNSGIFGKEFWQEGISSIIAEHGLPAISTFKLGIIADTCAEYKGASCRELDEEILRRSGYKTEKNYSARKAALRQGIVTPDMVEWLKSWQERSRAGKESSIQDDKEAAEIRRILDLKIKESASPTRH